MRAALPLARLVMPLLAVLPASAWQGKKAHSEEEMPVPKEIVVEPGTPKAWALLACSVLFERNGYRHDTLGAGPATKENVVKVRKLLDEWWEVKSAKDLASTLTWLDKEGHRADFEKFGRQLGKLSARELEKKLDAAKDDDDRASMKFAAENWPRTGKKSILGWDLGRYVGLCRWGYAAGYLTEDEAWQRIMPVAERLQKTFTSWEDLAENFCLGREFWKPGDNEDTLKASEKLSKDEKSPWKTTPWALDLHQKASK
jgi:hypothetical protein